MVLKSEQRTSGKTGSARALVEKSGHARGHTSEEEVGDGQDFENASETERRG